MENAQDSTSENNLENNNLHLDEHEDEQRDNKSKFNRMHLLGILGGLLLIGGVVFFLAERSSASTTTESLANKENVSPTSNEKLPFGIVTAEENEMPQIAVTPVAQKTIDIAEETTGKVAYNEEKMTPVFTPYAGRVVELLANKGNFVKAGQPLLIIEAPELIGVQNDLSSARSDEHKAKIALDIAQKNADRTHHLLAREAIAAKDVQQADSDLERAKDELARAQAGVKIVESRLAMYGKKADEITKTAESGKGLDQRVIIRAPISGTIVDRKVGLGQYIKPDAADAMFLISDLSTLWVMADVYENWLPQIHIGAPVQISLDAYPNHNFPAHITFINPTVDPATRTLHVRCTVPNGQGLLKPEMFAKIKIGAAIPQTVAAIPTSAIISQGQDSFIFVEESPRRFQRRQVHPGRVLQDLTEVAELKPNERVVTRGVMLLNMQIKAEPAKEEKK